MTQLCSLIDRDGSMMVHRIMVRLVVDSLPIWQQGVEIPVAVGKPISPNVFALALGTLNRNTGPDVAAVTEADCLFDGEWRDHG